MNEIVKNQHYVPQCYLRYFSQTRKKISKVSLFDKKKCVIRENQNIEKVASERFFYDIDFETVINEANESGIKLDSEDIEIIKKIDKQQMEHTFSDFIESEMFVPIKEIVTSYTMMTKSSYSTRDVITEDKREKIAYYLAMQFLRTKKTKELMVQIYETIKTGRIKKKLRLMNVMDDFSDDFKIKLKDSQINLRHNILLMDPEIVMGIESVFLSCIWFIAVNETEISFCTSDNPVVKNGRLKEQGLSTKGMEIIFPLTPKLALVMRERDYFSSTLKAENKFFNIDEKYVHYCNLLQLQQSYRYIYSKYNDLEFVKKYPNLQDIDISRVTYK
ncbi:DUF4238 domain-containing protein [Clostridium gasigenes]|uniref:DUF4238 domain-containing protein n=1 Tax=Clostridium gasigenes TaxID=94869 RepID=UPI001438505F|nr:DUF4238 domain-containing protein [Clostridium gasigenes]NKF05283.1 DUF4238 domain-containing protein [Clostridium gasigenes]QSW18738.1 DUF4238 domain-containing protein [Clostridium gasigenes]